MVVIITPDRNNRPSSIGRLRWMKFSVVGLAILYGMAIVATTTITWDTTHDDAAASAQTTTMSSNGISHSHQAMSGWSISSLPSSLSGPSAIETGTATNSIETAVSRKGDQVVVIAETMEDFTTSTSKNDGGTKNSILLPPSKTDDRKLQNVVESPRRRKKVRRGRGTTAKAFNASAIDPRQMHESLHSFYTQDGTLPIVSPHKRWNDPNSTTTAIPQWMRDYFNWHEYKQKHWSEERFEEDRWLVMQCLKTNRKCGGTSDRLKPVAYLLRAAYYSKRILLIHWTKPYELTEFLVPPKVGLDWRVTPRWLRRIVENRVDIGKEDYAPERVLGLAMDPGNVLVRSRMQDYHGGGHWYDTQVVDDEPSFIKVFHEIWKTLFTPSLAVKTRLESTMAEMGLKPYRYTGAHCRVLYAMDDREEWVKKNWAENAINCASELRPQKTIFFTSDSANATYYAQQYGEHHNRPVKIATRIPDPNPPLHIDFEWRGRPASDFFDGFVDLYILASADCVTYNKGGFGFMGSLMGRNATCSLRQDAISRPQIRKPCHWVDDPYGSETDTNTRSHYVPPSVHENSPMWKEWEQNPVYLEATVD
jgi:hypothetical protein